MRNRNIPQLRENFNANLAQLAGAGGKGLANAGAGIASFGEKNLAQKAQNKAFNLEDKKYNLDEGKYKNARMDLQKKESREEAEKKSNVNATRKFLESNYKIDTKDMSDDDIFYNGQRLENIYKDKTSRTTPKFFSTNAGVVAVYSDEKGQPVTKLVFDAGTKENKAKREKTDGYIQMPDYLSGAEADEFSTKTSFDGVGGTWVSKDEWANFENAKKVGDKEIR